MKYIIFDRKASYLGRFQRFSKCVSSLLLKLIKFYIITDYQNRNTTCIHYETKRWSIIDITRKRFETFQQIILKPLLKLKKRIQFFYIGFLNSLKLFSTLLMFKKTLLLIELFLPWIKTKISWLKNIYCYNVKEYCGMFMWI